MAKQNESWYSSTKLPVVRVGVGPVDERVDSPASVLAALELNGDRRARAQADVRAARDELRDLLKQGQKLGLGVSRMCRTTHLSRDTAHRLLREKRPSAKRTKKA